MQNPSISLSSNVTVQNIITDCLFLNMRKHFNIGYWLVVVLLMSLIFSSVVDGYSKALLLAVMFLPGA